MAEPLLLTAQKSTNVHALSWQLRAVRAAFRPLGALAPGLAARWAEDLFRTVRRHRRPGREERWLAGAERFEIPMGGRRLAAWSWGQGPPVLLVHGWEGRGSQLAAFAAPLAEAGFRAVAFDAPGHGSEERNRSSLPEFAEAVKAAAAAVGEPAGVAAHSFGVAGTCLALRRGLRLPRLVFVAAPDDLDFYIAGFAALLGLTPRVRRGMIRRLESLLVDASWEETRRVTLEAGRPDTPLLVVQDRDDEETPLAAGEAVAAAWPRGRLIATSGLGHRRILRDPGVVARVVEFLAQEG